MWGRQVESICGWWGTTPLLLPSCELPPPPIFPPNTHTHHSNPKKMRQFSFSDTTCSLGPRGKSRQSPGSSSHPTHPSLHPGAAASPTGASCWAGPGGGGNQLLVAVQLALNLASFGKREKWVGSQGLPTCFSPFQQSQSMSFTHSLTSAKQIPWTRLSDKGPTLLCWASD